MKSLRLCDIIIIIILIIILIIIIIIMTLIQYIHWMALHLDYATICNIVEKDL